MDIYADRVLAAIRDHRELSYNPRTRIVSCALSRSAVYLPRNARGEARRNLSRLRDRELVHGLKKAQKALRRAGLECERSYDADGRAGLRVTGFRRAEEVPRLGAAYSGMGA